MQQALALSSVQRLELDVQTDSHIGHVAAHITAGIDRAVTHVVLTIDGEKPDVFVIVVTCTQTDQRATQACGGASCATDQSARAFATVGVVGRQRDLGIKRVFTTDLPRVGLVVSEFSDSAIFCVFQVGEVSAQAELLGGVTEGQTRRCVF